MTVLIGSAGSQVSNILSSNTLNTPSTFDPNSLNTPSWSVSAARHHMIEQQIRPWGILEPRVLEVLSIIKRELFVQEAQTTLAFSDIQLPIFQDHPITKNSAVMLEPRIEARILQAIMPHGKEEVLEVGSGSGYMAALLGYFSKFVTTVELNPAIAEFATVNLNKCRIPNVRVEVGDALQGWKVSSNTSYDLICLSGGVYEVSHALQNQLKVGGKLFAFIGDELLMSATIIRRVSHDYFQQKRLFEALVPSLVDSSVRHSFVF